MTKKRKSASDFPDIETDYLRHECAELGRKLEERENVIRFIVRGALAIEAERDELRRLAAEDVPF